MKQLDPTPPTTYVTIAAAAASHDCSPMTLRRLIARGELPAYRLGGARSVRIKLEDLDALMRPIPAGGTAA